eukprot:gb/GEZN01003888.1/.p1 GENE.gb/GEZN01003888.1/~~gb/GEZN01003888.1/.p1  ORF type:complete len:566 (+),score=86.30 gb/GEZN01003888.1/:130-1827(+)
MFSKFNGDKHSTRDEERPIEHMKAREEEEKKLTFFEKLAPFYLDSILEHEQTRSAFKSYLEEQLCVENLLFWLAAQEYRILAKAKVRTEPVEVMYSGLNLWRSYLEPGSKYEVSLPSSTFLEVKGQLEKGLFGIYTFAKAQEQAYHDMLQDSMPKFVKSSAYQVMLRELCKDLAPLIVRNTEATWKCKMCIQVNNRARVNCANCGYKHLNENFISFETTLRHPLGQAVLQTWLKDRSRKRDVVILDYILAVTRLKNTPFSKEEQATQCAQMLDSVRPLIKYIQEANRGNAGGQKLAVKTLIESLPALTERLRTNVYPRFVKGSVHRHFIHAMEKLQSEGEGGAAHSLDGENSDSDGEDHTRGEGTPPLSPIPNGDSTYNPPTPPTGSSTRMMQQEDLDGDEDLDDFAAMLSRPMALSSVKVDKISKEVAAIEYAKKFWTCNICKKDDNSTKKDECLNCGLKKGQQLDKDGKIRDGPKERPGPPDKSKKIKSAASEPTGEESDAVPDLQRTMSGSGSGFSSVGVGKLRGRKNTNPSSADSDLDNSASASSPGARTKRSVSGIFKRP